MKNYPCYVFPYYKLLITFFLLILTTYNVFILGTFILYPVIAAVITAIILDSIIIKFTSKNWYFPSGAVISSLIIAHLVQTTILNTIILIILSLILKYSLRPKYRNIFNPAALAVVVASLLFTHIPFLQPVFSSWWASSKYITPALGLILIILIKRLSIALSFLIPYIILESFRSGITNGIQFLLTGTFVYFAFFMVVEPVTSPTKTKGRIIFGIIIAILAFELSFFPYFLSNSFFLYIPLLFANLMLRINPRRIFD